MKRFYFWTEPGAIRGSTPWGSFECHSGFGLALALINWDHDGDGSWSINIHLGWPDLFIPVPLPLRQPKDQVLDKWGFSFLDWHGLQLSWGHRCKTIYMPWSWVHIRHEVRRTDGSWVPAVDSWEEKSEHCPNGKEPDGRELFTFPYTYKLKSGVVQHCIATVHVDRRAWRRRWLRWLPWGERVEQSIAVEFDGEVGERTGSWKGGCIGCGCTMLPGETPEDTLRRMERERKFG